MARRSARRRRRHRHDRTRRSGDPLGVDAKGTSPSAGALRYLWARQRIAELSDEEALTGDEEHRDAIVALGLQYSLLTQHTSFVAVDQVVRVSNPDGTQTVDQPLPLPKGVSNLAVGGARGPRHPRARDLGAARGCVALHGIRDTAATPLQRGS